MTAETNDEGVFAAIWRRYGKFKAFRFGLAAGAVGVCAWGVARITGGPVREVALAVAVLAVTASSCTLAYNFYVHGPLESGKPPSIEGAPKPVKVAFAGTGGVHFRHGAGEVHFPEGAIRFVEWEREWWDVIVIVGLVLATRLASVAPNPCFFGAIVMATGLPRRRAIIADVAFDDIERVDVSKERTVVVTKSGEPRREVTLAVTAVFRARLLETLKARLSVVHVEPTPPRAVANPAMSAKATSTRLDDQLAALRALSNEVSGKDPA